MCCDESVCVFADVKMGCTESPIMNAALDLPKGKIPGTHTLVELEQTGHKPELSVWPTH